MQNSELYRRGFVVPLSKNSENDLINDSVNIETEVKFFLIPNQIIFESLWLKGFFKMINYELNLMIDDYEDEIVENSKIQKLSKIVSKFKRQTNLNSEEVKVIIALEELLKLAIEKKSSIFFIM